ncbi:MAG TPA: hypothetical protein VGO22_03580 [Pseudorhizobium sp.]|jgi:hypothetical protein|nr:hypothetical protein [Pseudorhizobium sp.]
MNQATETAPEEPYEKGMHIIYDVLTRCAIVNFRGEMDIIGPYPNRAVAVAAAEDRCRGKGWNA